MIGATSDPIHIRLEEGMAESSRAETGHTPLPREADPAPPREADPAARPTRSEARAARGHSPKLIPDRRRYHRVQIRLLGRFMREDKCEYPCQIINMSAGGIALLAPVSGETGERIVVYADDIGRIEGVVNRSFPGGFAIEIIATPYKREKIANQLTWLVNRERLDMAEERTHDRVRPTKSFTLLTLPDGRSRHCQVLDISLSGASIAVHPRPKTGDEVLLGRMRGRVVRHHDQGVGIQFLDIQDPAAIRRQFG
jgi:hypothetical protein